MAGSRPPAGQLGVARNNGGVAFGFRTGRADGWEEDGNCIMHLCMGAAR